MLFENKDYVSIICPKCESTVSVMLDKNLFIGKREVNFSCKKCGHNFVGMFSSEEWNDNSRSGLNIEGVKYNHGYMSSANIVEIEKALNGLDGVDDDDIVELPMEEETETSKFVKRMNNFDDDFICWKEIYEPLIENKCSGDLAMAEIKLRFKTTDARHYGLEQVRTMSMLNACVKDVCRSFFVGETLNEDSVEHLIDNMSKDEIRLLVGGLRGPDKLFNYYREIMMLMKEFIDLYPSLLSVESFIHTFNDCKNVNFYGKLESDIKHLRFVDSNNAEFSETYIIALSRLAKALAIPVCLTNILNTGNYKDFSKTFANIKKKEIGFIGNSLKWYEDLSFEAKRSSTELNEGFMKDIYMPEKLLEYDVGTYSNIISYMRIMKSLYLISEMIILMLYVEFESKR